MPNIDAILKEALPNFKKGSVLNREFQDLINQDKSLKNSFRSSATGFFARRDPKFKMDANHLASSYFVASHGPSKKTMDVFLRDITSHNPPIKHVVALGNSATTSKLKADFYDYALQERIEKMGAYNVKIKKISGEIESVSPKVFAPKNVVVSELNVIEDKGFSKKPAEWFFDNQIPNDTKIVVTTIRMKDMHPLYLSERNKNNFALKDKLIEIAKLVAQNEIILVHCHSGVGRTGYFILMMELLNRYEEIFTKDDNPKVAANNIHDLLRQLRKMRPGLVLNQLQFEYAIKDAIHLHEYSLDKRLEVTPQLILPTREKKETNSQDKIPNPRLQIAHHSSFFEKTRRIEKMKNIIFGCLRQFHL